MRRNIHKVFRLTSEEICGGHAELIGASIGDCVGTLQTITHGVEDSILIVIDTPDIRVSTTNGIVDTQRQDLVHTDDLITV